MEKEQEYKIGANAYEFVQKHRSNLSHAKQAELQAMLKDFAIEQVKNSVVLADVMPRTFSKQSLKDAYIQGYRKRAIMSGLKYDHISELNAVTEFENWFINLYRA
jgi:hypothetical protein